MIALPKDDIRLMLEAGYIYLAMCRFKEAREIFEGVSELVPGHDVPQVSLANVYFSQGKFLESIRLIKLTLKDNPDSAYAHAHLGESQLFYGKKDEAVKSLQKASELEPEGKTGDFARALLDLIAKGYDPVELRKQNKAKADKQKAEGKKE